MTIRMTGIISGLDTDAIIKELMSAQSLKKTKIEQKKTKAEWKKEKWEELNTKLYALYTKQVSKMKLQGSYMTKKVTSSNESIATATASSSAATGSHTLEVTELASSQYVTGKQLTGVTSNSKLVSNLGMTSGTVITVKSGDTERTLTVTEDTKVSDFITTLQSAGLNASFDATQGRFFISSKESGVANAFSITAETVASDSALATTKKALTDMGVSSSTLDSYNVAVKEMQAKYDAYSSADEDKKLAAWKEYEAAEKAVTALEETIAKEAVAGIEKQETEEATNEVVAEYIEAMNEAVTNAEADESVKETDEYKAYISAQESVDKSYYKCDEDGNVEVAADGSKTFSDTALSNAEAAIKSEVTAEIEKQIAEGTVTFDSVAKKEEAIEAAIKAKYTELANEAGTTTGTEEEIKAAALEAKAQKMYDTSFESALKTKAMEYATTDEAGKAAVKAKITDTDGDGISDAVEAATTDVATAINNYNTEIKNGTTTDASDSTQLNKLGLTTISSSATTGTTADGVSIVAAADAKIKLDGAELTGSSNNFTAAGITFELKNTTAATGAITLSATNDVDAVYNSIKDFFKEYNSILEEMNKLYNATSSRGYEPLTDEEKEAMSEEQIELWEDKIKDSLLRRDSTLGGIADAMRTAMQTSVTVDGKQYSLASFGIMTSSDYTERGLLHIYGDEDDAVYSTNADKLKAALTENADVVAQVMAGVMNKLSDTMMDKMKKTSLSSALTFYNDIQMKNTIEDYDDELDKWEDKLKDMEDRYYKQFSAMETAMAKMQSQSSYLASLMGTGQ